MSLEDVGPAAFDEEYVKDTRCFMGTEEPDAYRANVNNLDLHLLLSLGRSFRKQAGKVDVDLAYFLWGGVTKM